jgi:hypothetical protein
MILRRLLSGWALVTILLGSIPVARASDTPVTACGQTVSGVGVLTADLDCSATAGPAVKLAKGARLELGGFTLTATDTGVLCDTGRCAVTGPGTIRRPSYAPTSSYGVYAYYRLRIADVVLENWPYALSVLGPLSVKHCTVRGGGWGTLAEVTTIVDSSFENNAIGVRGTAGTPSGPGFGIRYIFWPVSVRHSTFTGNTIDVASYRRPVVHDSSCTTSDHLTLPDEPFGGGDEWGVCQ